MCRFSSAMRRVFFGFQQEPIQLGTGRGRRWHRSYKAPGTKMLPAPPAPFLPLCWVLGGCRGDAVPQNLQLGGSWCPACWVGRGCGCLAVLHRNHTGLVGKEGTSGTPGAIATGRWSWEEGGINKIKASAASRATVKGGEAVAGLKLPGGFLVSDFKCNKPPTQRLPPWDRLLPPLPQPWAPTSPSPASIQPCSGPQFWGTWPRSILRRGKILPLGAAAGIEYRSPETEPGPRDGALLLAGKATFLLELPPHRI